MITKDIEIKDIKLRTFLDIRNIYDLYKIFLCFPHWDNANRKSRYLHFVLENYVQFLEWGDRRVEYLLFENLWETPKILTHRYDTLLLKIVIASRSLPSRYFPPMQTIWWIENNYAIFRSCRMKISTEVFPDRIHFLLYSLRIFSF